MDDLAQRIIRQGEAAKGDRSTHESTWRECFDYSWPELGNGIGGNLVTASDLQAKKARVVDSVGREAATTLAAGLIGGMCPANAIWFGLEVDGQDDAEKKWLSEAAKVIWKNLHASNFDSTVLEAMKLEVASGWFCHFVEEAEGGGYACETWPLAGCYPRASRRGAPVDTIYREYELTAEQAVAEFGETHVSERVRRQIAENKPTEKTRYWLAIYPRQAYAVGAALARNKRFAQVVVDAEARIVVQEGGYDEFPVQVPRWSLIPGTDYATGPFSDALATVKRLNHLGYNEMAATDLAVAGMWIGVDDGVLNPRSIRLAARKVVAAASTENLKELKSGADFNVAWTKAEQLEAQIRRILMADQLQPQDKAQMTAYEVSVRVAVIRQLLGPIFGRLQSEFLQPLIQRCFGIALRAGILGEPPASLANRRYVVKYVSPLARAQMLEEVVAIEAWYQSLGVLAQAKQDTSVFDVADDDKAARHLADGRGVPAELMRDPEEVAGIRQQRAEAQQQAQQQAQAEAVQLEAVKGQQRAA